MKKKYLGLIKTITDDSPSIGGLSRGSYASVTNASSSSPTLKNMEKMYKYLTSKKYQKKVAEQQYRKAMGERILALALVQQVITEDEYYRLMMSTQINGMLMVSSDMYKRLEKVDMKEDQPFKRKMNQKLK